MLTQTAGKSKLRNSGAGPGVQTLDGCSVDFYVQLPPGGEIGRVIEGRAPPASLLELGAGCGRLTVVLSGAGYSVTAVDNSAEMLKHIECADTVLSDIESLRLTATFDVVLLASCLLNCPDESVRNLMLSTARTHLTKGGILLLEVHTSGILGVKVGENSVGEHYTSRILASETHEQTANITIEYSIADETWSHSFETEYLSPEQLDSLLTAHGFDFAGWLDSKQTWLKAVAV